MKNAIRENKITSLLLAVGLICALILCGIRLTMEARNTEIAVVMEAEDLALIGGGLPGVISFSSGEVIPALNLWLSDGESYTPSAATVGLVEDMNQYSFVAIEGFSPDGASPAPMARVFRLFPNFAARYAYLGYSGAEEIENILYRAVTDRNIRVIWLEPFVNARTGEMITDAAVYSEVLSTLSERIAPHGLTLENSFSVFPSYTPNTLLIIGCLLGLAAAGVLLLRSFFPLPRRACLLLTVLGIAACAAALFLRPTLATQLFSLATAIIFPCLALWYAAASLDKAEDLSPVRNLASYALVLICSVCICIAGGLFVSAFQSSTNYLLAVENFRGVKISQALPIIFAVYIVFRRMYGRNGIRDILAGKKFMLALVIMVLAAGIIYYLLRTGDGAVSVSALEQRFRNWLEHLLIARPRTKEFLISWPCLGLAYALTARGARRYAWPFAILASPGLASVVNTFCHSRAPVWLSVTRSVLGLIIGLAIGIILVYILSPKKKALPK